MLTEQAIAARRAYKRAWARKNPDKVKQSQERYWQRRAEQQAQEQQTEQQAQQAPPAQEMEAARDGI